MQPDLRVIDVDSHVIERPDLWTSRISSSWGDRVPRVVHDDKLGLDRWLIGDELTTPVAYYSAANWRVAFPSFPPTLEVADPGGHDPVARLEQLDRYGIYAQVLYPNLIGFNCALFAELEGSLGAECVRAYNDFLAEFASADPARLVPIMMLPFWDIAASVAEIERAVALGHRGILFAVHWDRLGLPDIGDERWTPILEAAQSNDLSFNFHIGFERGVEFEIVEDRLPELEADAQLLLSNSSAIAKVISKGLCHRYPDLRFVSVESGFGYVPWLLQCMDWAFHSFDIPNKRPEMLLPSEYFQRQFFTTFWFEQLNAADVERYQDNVMFETDYPHPLSLTGNLIDRQPLEFAQANVQGLSPAVTRKVLFENAARLYGIGEPTPGPTLIGHTRH